MACTARPLRPTEGSGPGELVPGLRDIARILAEKSRCDLTGMGELPRPPGSLGIADPEAAMTVAGLDLAEQDRDLGHRLLAAGQHLGVADRRLERQIH